MARSRLRIAGGDPETKGPEFRYTTAEEFKPENYEPLTDSEFRINGVRFPIEPQSISIWEEASNYKYETLRNRESVKIRSGHSRINITVQAIFTERTVPVNQDSTTSQDHIGETTDGALLNINSTLMPILYSLKKLPLCFIENELLRASLPVSESEPIAAFVKMANISTVQGMPEALSATFQFVWYNHRPFSPRIKFRKEWLTPDVAHFINQYSTLGRSETKIFEKNKQTVPAVGRFLEAKNPWLEEFANARRITKSIYYRNTPDTGAKPSSKPEQQEEDAPDAGNIVQRPPEQPKQGSPSPYQDHIGRHTFIDTYGHPSTVFNATAADNYTEDISEARPLLEYLWPYAHETTNPAIKHIGTDPAIIAMPPFVLSGFEQNIEFQFTLIDKIPTVKYKGKERDVFDVATSMINDDDDDTNRTTDVTGGPSGFRWPFDTQYDITSRTNENRKTTINGITTTREHKGIDIGAPEGTDILAAKDGEIAVYRFQKADPDKGKAGAGRYITIDHGKYFTRYMHMQEDSVPKKFRKIGVEVKKGDVIGKVGHTGIIETAAHLHFEISDDKRGRTTIPDPENFLEFYQGKKHTVKLQQRPVVIADPEELLKSLNNPDELRMSTAEKLIEAVEVVTGAISATGGPNINIDYTDPNRERVIKELERLMEEGWSFERDLVTGKAAMLRPITLEIPDGAVDIIPQEISMGFGSNLAMIPLAGHRFPTVQYIGGQQTAVSLSLRAEGDDGRQFIKNLRDLIDATENAAIHFREFSKYRGIGIVNPLINSLNIFNVLVEDRTVDTVPGNPEGLNVAIRLIDNTVNSKQPPLLTPRGDIDSDHIFQTVIAELFRRGWLSVKVGNAKKSTRLTIDGEEIDFASLPNRTPLGIDPSSEYQPLLEMAVAEPIIKYDVSIVPAELNGEKAIINTVLAQLAEHMVKQKSFSVPDTEEIGPGLVLERLTYAEYSDTVKTPPPRAFKDLREARPFWDTISNAYQDPAIRSLLTRKAHALLIALGSSRNLEEDAPVLDGKFAHLLGQVGDLVSFIEGNDCYPDLLLPPNPITGLTIDTNPDFFLYNESDIVGCKETVFNRIHGDDPYSPKKDGTKAARVAAYNGVDNLKRVFGTHPDQQGKDGVDYEGLRPANEGRWDEETNSPVYKSSALSRFKTSGINRGITKPLPEGGLLTRDDPLGMRTNIENRGSRGKREAALDFHHASSPYKKIIADNPSRNAHQIQHVFHPDEYNKVFEEFADNYNGEHFTVRRSFPTFKIFFVEEDSNIAQNEDDDTLNNLIYAPTIDDFYSVNAIKEIRVVGSKDMAATTCIIKVLDLDGILYNRKFLDTNTDFGSRDDVSIENKSPFSNTVIKEGMKVVVKLGTSNDPMELETVFVGQIVQFEGTDLVEIICQSYGTELVQQTIGTDPNQNMNFWNTLTVDVIHDLLDREEVRHFGRWRLEDIDVFGPVFGHEKLRPDGQIKKVWTWKPSVVDDNIFAPDDKNLGSWWAKVSGDLEYVLWQTTIWDTIKEMELRHPGCIAYPVPYGKTADARMTIFFGSPSQPYLSKPPSTPSEQLQEFYGSAAGLQVRNSIIDVGLHTGGPKEDQYLAGLRILAGTAENAVGLSVLSEDLPSGDIPLDHLLIMAPHAKKLYKRLKEAKEAGKTGAAFWRETMMFQDSRMKPFRNYDMVTSMTDIVSNEIRADHRDTFNSIELRYTNDTLARNDVDFVEFQNDSGVGTITVNLDDNIKEHHLRKTIESWPNCSTVELANRYASQLLANSMKKVYKGYLMTMGRAHLKPYDMIYLFDNYSDMSGPLEVEEVVHTFSRETGFITEIIPNMIVTVKDEVTMVAADMTCTFMGEMAKHILNTTDGERGVDSIGAGTAAAAGLGTALLPTIASVSGVLSSLLVYRFIKYCQTREPIVIIPLIKEGKPYVTGIEGMESDGLVVSDLFDPEKRNKFIDKTVAKKWRYWKDGIKDAVDIMRVGYTNWLAR